MKKLQSDFALLDVKHGCVGLAKQLAKGDGPVPIVLTGEIEGIWGHDDGESQEFHVKVKKVEILR